LRIIPGETILQEKIVIMKKTLLLFLFVAGAMAGMAQIKTINTRPITPTTRVDPAIVGPQKDLRKNVGKDLKITLASIEKNTSNFAVGSAGIYTIKFDIVNSGGENIDITGLGIQSTLNSATGFSNPQGGYSFIPGTPGFPDKPILTPGGKCQAIVVKNGFTPAGNNGSKFVIKIDHNNLIAETDETNNSLEIPVIGNLESSSTPLPDLTFQVNSITPVGGGGFINTNLDISLVNTGAGEIPLDVVNQLFPMVQVYPAGSPGTNLYHEVFPLGTRTAGTQTYPGYYKANGPLKSGDKVRLGGGVRINGMTPGATLVFHLTLDNVSFPETNTANNTIDFLYTVK
jgi:hypothetical protein